MVKRGGVGSSLHVPNLISRLEICYVDHQHTANRDPCSLQSAACPQLESNTRCV
jgi:hypothetical protein